MEIFEFDGRFNGNPNYIQRLDTTTTNDENVLYDVCFEVIKNSIF